MASYAEDRANFIAQARQREAQNRVQQIQQEHAQTVAELDQAVADGDWRRLITVPLTPISYKQNTPNMSRRSRRYTRR
jgi:hypothetical protein